MIAHPCLYLNQHMIDVAKDNIAHQEWAAKTFQEMKLSADKLEQMQLPVFDTAWWQVAKTKDWHTTYPENMQHSYFVPRPATDAAFQSALVYALGGGDAYGERVKKVLLHYTTYGFESDQPDTGMNYSIWGINLLYSYDLTYDRFTPDERAKVDDFFKRLVESVAARDEWWIETGTGGRHNNHYAWHKLMMAAYGLFYGKDEWVTRSIESRDGFRELLEVGLLDDGLWFESSLNYHYVAITAMMDTARMFRNSGYPLDLYTHKFAKGRSLEDGLSGMVQILFPDTSIPTTGDCYGGTSRLRGSPIYETAWDVYRKPLYAWLVEGAKPSKEWLFQQVESPKSKDERPTPPRAVSKVFPEHGYVMLRSVEGREYWDSDSWAAFLNFGVSNVHTHADKMNLILFGRGKVLAVDPEAHASVQHAFSSQVQKELNRSTVCHNTVMVDGKGHAGIGENLSLLDFERSPEVKTATVADLKGLIYPGVKMQRTVAVTDDYVLDVFQITSDEEHTYDWLFHARDDEGKTRIYGGFEPATLPDAVPWTWLKNPRSAMLDRTWHADWRQGDVRFRLTMTGAPGTEVVLCDFPKSDKFEAPPVPMLIARRKSKSAVFIALYQAEKKDVPAADIRMITDEKDGMVIRVTVHGSAREHKIRHIYQVSPPNNPAAR
jgi:hypothetical protein